MFRRANALLATAGFSTGVLLLPLLIAGRKRGLNSKAHEADGQGYPRQRDLSRPKWAPPEWVAPVAWVASTVPLAAVAQRLAFRQNHPRRAELLGYIGLHTLLYATQSRVCDDGRSPVLAAVWTVSDSIVCHLALYRALRVNKRIAAGFVPVNLWLTLAVPLKLHQAAANPDPHFGYAAVEAAETLAAALGRSPLKTQAAV